MNPTSNITVPSVPAPIDFIISRQGQNYLATPAGGKTFYIGSRTSYKGLAGLVNTRVQDGPVYDPALYEKEHGFWAWFVYPTAMCESKLSFHCLNTYDRAAFTFGFMQYGAHVPGGCFVKLMRSLLALPEAKQYFPSLELRNGFIFNISNNQPVQLETNNDTTKLMRYLNGSSASVDQDELQAAVRFVHWAQSSEAHCALQVSVAIDAFRDYMKAYAVQYKLNGLPDYICHTVCDIRHQGRASSAQIRAALSSGNNEAVYVGLLKLGAALYAERIHTLRDAHQALIQKGVFGKHIYDAGNEMFV